MRNAISAFENEGGRVASGRGGFNGRGRQASSSSGSRSSAS